jgi:hypothetical protein
VTDWPGVDDRPAREALLQALAHAVRDWRAYGVSCAGGVVPPFAGNDDARAAKVLGEAIRTDGGSGAPTLDTRTAEEGKSLGVALHEEWPDFDPLAAPEGEPWRLPRRLP